MRDRLKYLESVLEKNQKNFCNIGKALKEIRDERLYRAHSFNRFEQYTKSRWDMGKSHAYRLIEAYEVIENLSPIGERLPQNEAQVRPLTRLSPSEQRKFWREFSRSDFPLKASSINRCVSVFMGKKKSGPTIDLTAIISKDYHLAVMNMLEQIRQAQNDRWKGTSRPAARYWNNVMKEKIEWKS